MTELNMEDRYQLRKLQMDVDKKALEVQKAQQDLDRFVLELEHKYDLMGPDKAIDPRSAMVEDKDPLPPRNGRGRTEALLAPEKSEAAA